MRINSSQKDIRSSFKSALYNLPKLCGAFTACNDIIKIQRDMLVQNGRIYAILLALKWTRLCFVIYVDLAMDPFIGHVDHSAFYGFKVFHPLF